MRKECHNAGVLGFNFVLYAGHGKLFIADVDGMSASNEIPLFVSQIPFQVPGRVRLFYVGIENLLTRAARWYVQIVAEDRRISRGEAIRFADELRNIDHVLIQAPGCSLSATAICDHLSRRPAAYQDEETGVVSPGMGSNPSKTIRAM